MTHPSQEAVVEEIAKKMAKGSDGDRRIGTGTFLTPLDKRILNEALTNYAQTIRDECGNRNAVVKEYKKEGAMFILKVEDGKTYEASMPIPKWAEVGKLEYRTPTTNHTGE